MLQSHTWPLLLSGFFFWVTGAITIELTSESAAPIILSLIAVFSAYQSYKARDAGQKVAQVKVAAETTVETLNGLKQVADATHVLVNSANASLLMEIANLKAEIQALKERPV